MCRALSLANVPVCRYEDVQIIVAFCACVQWQRYLYHTTKALLAEYPTSYTNTLQLVDYQYFTQCRILPNPPTRNLHTPHTATRHKHGRAISRHRGTEKSVAPTDFSTSQWCITHRIRQNRLRCSGVRCVRCVQGSVRYLGIILHSLNILISTCYVHKV